MPSLNNLFPAFACHILDQPTPHIINDLPKRAKNAAIKAKEKEFLSDSHILLFEFPNNPSFLIGIINSSGCLDPVPMITGP
ncbi:hypothetical protein [Methanospirillum sp.]|uniref:hypothetical protein n=1 Tax=Methanospirillum sp. TaxID=45200 RepID=UPI0035A1A9E8